MVKKLVKQNLRFYSKFLLLIGALIAFVCSFGVSSYAWSTDSNGNLVSENILTFENGTYNGLGVTYQCRDNKIYLSGTASSSGPLWVNISISSGSYVFQTFNDFTYNDGFRLTLRNGYGTIKSSCSFTTTNAYDIFTSNVDMDILAISVVSGVNYDNVVLTPSLVVGSTPLPSYEPYGAIYYSESNMDKMVQSSYGSFAYASAIRLYYNNGSVTQLYKTYSNCYDMILENWCSFRNGSLNIDDYGLIFTTLGGNSNWYYYIGVDFPSYSIKVDTFKDWYFYGYSKFEFITYSNTYVLKSSYEVMNPFVIDLTDNSINNLNTSDYIKTINYYRKNPNVGISYGQFGTPNSSIQYNIGYNDGIEKGYDNGFDNGFTDGKNEGYTLGYNDGYRDGEESDFTTNGFKTLIGSIFNYPINMIRSVFNFEFMGINIYSIIVFIMSIGIVIFVIRRFKK